MKRNRPKAIAVPNALPSTASKIAFWMTFILVAGFMVAFKLLQGV